MSSIDASQVAELVTNVGYGVMFEMYEAQELVFPQFCEVVDAETTFSPLYGDKGAVIQRVESHKEREDGQPVEHPRCAPLRARPPRRVRPSLRGPAPEGPGPGDR